MDVVAYDMGNLRNVHDVCSPGHQHPGENFYHPIPFMTAKHETKRGEDSLPEDFLTV